MPLFIRMKDYKIPLSNVEREILRKTTTTI